MVTPAGPGFAATAEGFWSARWTEDSLLSNLSASGISPEDVVFNDLNQISWLVEIKKQAGGLSDRVGHAFHRVPN